MTNQSLLAAWGVTTTAGYLLTHAMGVAGTEVFGMSVFGSIVAVWALLMLPPVGMTVARKARGRTDSHHWVWVGLVAAALAVNVGVVVGGGGHTHGGSGHGEAAEGASGHGEPGHHAESSATGGDGGTLHRRVRSRRRLGRGRARSPRRRPRRRIRRSR